MAKVDDVAAYILSKCDGRISTMKLQKLLYYSQGWALAWDSEPLFDAPIQAWANGPVVPEIFRQHKGLFSVESWPTGDPAELTGDEKETVDAVMASYGQFSGQALSDKTHQERPWLEARGDTSPGEASRTQLDLDTMQDYFGGLDTLNG